MASLALISAEGLPKDIRNEDAVVNIIGAIKSHLLVNVLAVHSSRLANVHRAQHGENRETAFRARDASSCFTSRAETFLTMFLYKLLCTMCSMAYLEENTKMLPC